MRDTYDTDVVVNTLTLTSFLRQQEKPLKSNEQLPLEGVQVLARLAVYQYSRIASHPQSYRHSNKAQVLTVAAAGFTYPEGYDTQGWYRALYAYGFDAWCAIDTWMRKADPLSPVPAYCYRCPIVESLAGLSHASLIERHPPKSEPVLWCHRNELSPVSQLHKAAGRGDIASVQKNAAILMHAAEETLRMLSSKTP